MPDYLVLVSCLHPAHGAENSGMYENFLLKRWQKNLTDDMIWFGPLTPDSLWWWWYLGGRGSLVFLDCREQWVDFKRLLFERLSYQEYQNKFYSVFQVQPARRVILEHCVGFVLCVPKRVEVAQP